MGKIEKNLICDELRKNDLCRKYWSEQMEHDLEKDIQLVHEPVGDMAIYSKYFEFCANYCGEDDVLSKTYAIIKINITSNQPEYDIKKAMAGNDCFHNVRISVKKGEKILLTGKFRLWSNEEAEYCGNESSLSMLLL